MKYIKTYEKNKTPVVGDYVIGFSLYFTDETINYLKSHIGKIIGYNEEKFQVQYKDVPENIKNNNDFFIFVPIINDTFFATPLYYVLLHSSEINHFSKNKEDLDFYISANKYNI